MAGIKEIRAVMAEAEEARRLRGRRTILFVDEIHRFNKAQQDAFLPRVEAGDIVLIGATTENPSFEVNSALLSRSKVYVLKPLRRRPSSRILRRALADAERGLGDSGLEADDEALIGIARYANGDARVALNMLELAAAVSADAGRIDTALIADLAQNRALLYDKTGEEHYNLISALHKSLRNSDPDASVYWLARMLESGEDAALRRAPARALRLGGHRQRRPAGADDRHGGQGRRPLRRACRRATPRSRRRPSTWRWRPRATPSTRAYSDAAEAAKTDVAEPVPLHLRNAPTRLMKALDYGKGYKYAHDETGRGRAEMECLPPAHSGRQFYVPTDRGLEAEIRKKLEKLRQKR